jgi:predicted transcriptional regulator
MYDYRMRTTIELSDEHRARLLAIAAARGEKGFSTIIAEAVDHYLDQQDARDSARALARTLRGALPPREAERLRTTTAEWRERWR